MARLGRLLNLGTGQKQSMSLCERERVQRPARWISASPNGSLGPASRQAQRDRHGLVTGFQLHHSPHTSQMQFLSKGNGAKLAVVVAGKL